MSELGDDFAAMREHGKIKKKSNLQNAKAVFAENEVEFSEKSPIHFIVGEYDFWPSTGLFISRRTRKRGRGIFNLIKKVKGTT